MACLDDMTDEEKFELLLAAASHSASKRESANITNTYRVLLNGSIHRGLKKLEEQSLPWKEAKSSTNGPELRVMKILGLVEHHHKRYHITELGLQALYKLNACSTPVKSRDHDIYRITCPKCRKVYKYGTSWTFLPFQCKCGNLFGTCFNNKQCHDCKARVECLGSDQICVVKHEIETVILSPFVTIETYFHKPLPTWG